MQDCKACHKQKQGGSDWVFQVDQIKHSLVGVDDWVKALDQLLGCCGQFYRVQVKDITYLAFLGACNRLLLSASNIAVVSLVLLHLDLRYLRD